jgi:hypothetical protein
VIARKKDNFGSPELADAFYLPLGEERFLPTEHTVGPWSADAQHFGPPSALLVRGLERIPTTQEALLGRVTIEILGPAPLSELTVRAKVERPGRSVELLSAELRTSERVVAKASAWRIATSDSSEVATPEDKVDTSPVNQDPANEETAVEDSFARGKTETPNDPTSLPLSSWAQRWAGGYFQAMEWRALPHTPQPATPTIWARQRIELVEGEKPSPSQRVFAVADSGNGASSPLDLEQWWFINSELSVHCHREPEGEWIGMSATMAIGRQGVGTATSRLYDTRGQLGVGAQALLIRRRQA